MNSRLSDSGVTSRSDDDIALAIVLASLGESHSADSKEPRANVATWRGFSQRKVMRPSLRDQEARMLQSVIVEVALLERRRVAIESLLLNAPPLH